MEEEDKMPNPADRLRLKDRIIESIGKAVKHIQTYQFNTIQTSDSLPILNNSDWQFHKIAEHLDHAFLHGLKHITNGYWVVVREFTHKSTVNEITTLQNVTTNLGKGRAWLYQALNDHLLESYARCFLDNSKLVKKHYVKEALVLDQQRMQILLTLAAGIESVNFQLDVDMPYLDLSSYYMYKPKVSVSEDGDDKLSLCSMESCSSQCSSAAGSYKRCLSDVFIDNPDSGQIFGSGYRDFVNQGVNQENSKSKPLVRNACSLPILKNPETEQERIIRISKIDPKARHTSIQFDSTEDDVEVIRIKSKSTKLKKKSTRRKPVTDPEKISVASTSSNNSENLISSSLTTPESGYRSNVECLSLRTSAERGDCSSDNIMVSSTGTDFSYNQDGAQDAGQSTKTLPHSSSSPKGMIFQFSESESISSPQDTQPTIKDVKEEESENYDSSQTGEQNPNHTAGTIPDIYATAKEPSSTSDPGLIESATPDVAADSTVTGQATNNLSKHQPCYEDGDNERNSYEAEDDVGKRSSVQDTIEIIAKHKVIHQNAAPTQASAKHVGGEVNVDNNTMLILMLEVFSQEEEKFVKMYITCMGHTEGTLQPIFLLLTDRNLYLLTTSPDKTRFKTDALITFKEIDYVSLSINCQYINIVCINRRKQFWITTGDEELTSKIIHQLDHAIRHSDIDLPRLSILTDATTQRIAVKKWAADECNAKSKSSTGEVGILCYVLSYWEDTQALQSTNIRAGAIRDGTLLYKMLAPDKPNPGPWKPGYFILKDSSVFLYEDKFTNMSPFRQVQLNSETCSGCRRCRLEDREFGFEIILGEGDSILLCAKDENEQQDWLVALCQAVAEGQGRKMPNNGCLPCCCVLTKSKLLICHEDVQTNFFRTLGSADVTNVTRVLTDSGAKTYCVLAFESSDEGVESEIWVLYFNTRQEKERFLTALGVAWKSHFEVKLQIDLIEDNVLQKRCREGIYTLKQLRKV